MFENKNDRIVHTGYFLAKVEIKDYNVVIDGQSLFDQPIKNDEKHMITFEKLQLVKEMITELDVY